MELKNIIVEASTNAKDRKREGTRTFIEAYRRARTERVVSETTVGTYYRTPRQAMPAAWRPPFLRRNKDHKKEAKKDTASCTQKTRKSRFSSPYYRHLFPNK